MSRWYGRGSKHGDGDEQKALLNRLNKRREALVRKALRQAGIGNELAFSAGIETRATDFTAGVEKASRYAVPSHLRYLQGST